MADAQEAMEGGALEALVGPLQEGWRPLWTGSLFSSPPPRGKLRSRVMGRQGVARAQVRRREGEREGGSLCPEAGALCGEPETGHLRSSRRVERASPSWSLASLAQGHHLRPSGGHSCDNVAGQSMLVAMLVSANLLHCLLCKSIARAKPWCTVHTTWS